MKNIFRNSTYSIAETCWTGLSVFLLFRYVAAHLGVGAIGVWSLLVAAMSISSIADVGLGRALLHFVPTAVARDRRGEAASYVETAAGTVGVLFFAILLLALPAFDWAIDRFVAPAQRDIALQILPYALFSFWLSNISLVFLSALGGMQRYDLRSIVSMAGSATQLATAIFSIRYAGLLGLVWAQIAQNLVLVLGGVLCLRRVLPQVHAVPVNFNYSHFKMMRRYGTSLQLYTFVTFVFEPTTKLVLSHFGGLSMLGFYEMASRMANQVRTLVVNSIQVLVPGLAELHQQDKARAFQAYLRMSEVIWILACPIMAVVAMFLPAISGLWLGRQSHEFICFSLIVIVGWTVNLVCAPSFFMGLASGSLRWNLIGGMVMSGANLLLAPILGFAYGSVGVVVAFSLSLSAGSLTFFFFNHRSFGGTAAQMFNAPILQMLVLLVGAVGAGNLLFDAARNSFGIVATMGASIALIGAAIWVSLAGNPATRNLMSLFRARSWSPKRND